MEGNTVGLIFDRNTEGLVGTFAYDGWHYRTTADHPGYIFEALQELYDAEPLAHKLTNATFVWYVVAYGSYFTRRSVSSRLR